MCVHAHARTCWTEISEWLVTKLWAKQFGVQFPTGTNIFHISKMSQLLLWSPQPSLQWVLGFICPWIRRAGRDHQPSSSANVKNEWSFTNTLCVSLWCTQGQLFLQRVCSVILFAMTESCWVVKNRWCDIYRRLVK